MPETPENAGNDIDIALSKGDLWVTCDAISVHIVRMKDRVMVELWATGRDDEMPLDVADATFAEAEEGIS